MKTSSSILALTAPFTLLAGTAFADDAASWDLLAAIEIEEIVTETSYEVRKTFPAAIENGIEQFDITGFVVPLTDGPDVTEFILVSDMGFCPFCGSPEHGTSLQVAMAAPTTGLEEGTRVTLRGSLEANTDPQTFQSTIMTGARLMGG